MMSRRLGEKRTVVTYVKMAASSQPRRWGLGDNTFTSVKMALQGELY